MNGDWISTILRYLISADINILASSLTSAVLNSAESSFCIMRLAITALNEVLGPGVVVVSPSPVPLDLYFNVPQAGD